MTEESRSTVRFRAFDATCLDRFLELAATYYAPEHEARSPEYLNWAFSKNPAGAGRVVYAEARDGRWTGVMGLIPFRIRRGASVFTASMIVNVLVHPEHRNEKLFVKMIRHACAELSESNEWIIGHPNAAAVRGWQRTDMGFRGGYDIRIGLPRLHSRGSPEIHVADSASPALGLDFAPLHAWQEGLGFPVIAADADFLKWRFLCHPTQSYRVRVRHGSDGVVGYRVDRAFKSSLVRWFVDWQGDFAWSHGPGSALWPSMFAWPSADPRPKGHLLPRLRKHYEFFATPCASMENDGDPWSHLTLAATDFA